MSDSIKLIKSIEILESNKIDITTLEEIISKKIKQYCRCCCDIDGVECKFKQLNYDENFYIRLHCPYFNELEFIRIVQDMIIIHHIYAYHTLINLDSSLVIKSVEDAIKIYINEVTMKRGI